MTVQDNTETILTYEQDGQAYEIDHLGIGFPDTGWGQFQVYLDGQSVAEFVIPGWMNKPEFRPELPPGEELIEMAKEAVRSGVGL